MKNIVLAGGLNDEPNGDTTEAAIDFVRTQAYANPGIAMEFRTFKRMVEARPLNAEDIKRVYLYGQAGLEPRTMRSYSREFNKFLNEYLAGEYAVVELTIQHLHGFYDWRQDNQDAMIKSPEEIARGSCSSVIKTLDAAEKNCGLFAQVNPYTRFRERFPDIAAKILEGGSAGKSWTVRERALTARQWTMLTQLLDERADNAPMKGEGGRGGSKHFGESKQWWMLMRGYVWLIYSGGLRIEEVTKARAGDVYYSKDEKGKKKTSLALRNPKWHSGETVSQELLTDFGVRHCYAAWECIMNRPPTKDDFLVPIVRGQRIAAKENPGRLDRYQRALREYIRKIDLFPVARNAHIYEPGSRPFGSHIFRHSAIQHIADRRTRDGTRMEVEFEWLRHWARHKSGVTTRKYCETAQPISGLTTDWVKEMEDTSRRRE